MIKYNNFVISRKFSFKHFKKQYFISLSFLFFISLFFSCVSSHQYMPQSQEPDESLSSHTKEILESKANDINGFFPKKLYITTTSQTFTDEYQFCLQNGRIWEKNKKVPEWKLFLGTGLPFSSDSTKKTNWFAPPQIITEISCDDDILTAFDNRGWMYRIYLKKLPAAKYLQWENNFGWPVKEQVKLNSLVKDKRAWGISVRRSEILWYEDRYGNRHHWGTMGLATMYFLTADGQRILFTDSGMPVDFSNSILGPERGSFIAENLATSGSTIFLINKEGKMYTRLIDFDTMGCDPMFFKYTYHKEKQPYKGDEYISNFTHWALPNEDWKEQPYITLTGKARLSRFISIRQDGKGNFARTLRVAGISSTGKTGFYYKELAEKKWKFQEAPLQLKTTDFLPLALPENKQTKEIKKQIFCDHGKSQNISYSGNIYNEKGSKIENITCSIPDFTMTSEGNCTLSISNGKETKHFTLYPVEMWTYNVRFNPGYDGTPKYYFITASFDKNEITSDDKNFEKILQTLFASKNKELFAYSAEATSDYFELYTKNKTSSNYSIFLASSTDLQKEAVDQTTLKTLSRFSTYPLNKYNSSSLLLNTNKTYTITDGVDIAEKITNNEKYVKELLQIIRKNNKEKKQTNISRWGYNAADLIMTVTLLNQLDFPKFKTLSKFGYQLMNTNADKYEKLSGNIALTYPALITLIQTRIKYYKELLTNLKKQDTVKLNKNLKNDYTSYFNILNFPKTMEGISLTARKKCNIRQIKNLPYLNGFLLSFNKKESSDNIYIAMPDIINDLLQSLNTNEIENFSTKVVFSSLANNKSVLEKKAGVFNLDKKTGYLQWNGRSLKIYVQVNLIQKELLFFGTNISKNNSK